MTTKNPLRFYVYAYLRSRDSKTAKAGTPYYIGKGQGNRVLENHRHIPIPADKRNIVYLETNLSDIGALALERRYIQWYGRKDLNSGILVNLTDGGDGCSGLRVYESRVGSKNSFYGKTHSEESKKLISLRKTGTVITKEHADKIRKSNTGKKRTKEQNSARSILSKEIASIKLECPHCKKIGSGPAMKHHHFDNCPVFTGTKKIRGKNKFRKPLMCTHCGKVGNGAGMTIFHFNNCKFNRS